MQLGAVIMKKGKPLASYSQKWSKSQINYTMKKKEILNILETLKEFWNILLVHEIEVFIDHKNLTYEKIESAFQSVQHWKRLIQGFGVTLLYIKREANVVADDFSRLPIVRRAHKLSEITLE